MGELIRIGAPEGAAGLGATVDTTGAWITSLSSQQDYVLFPRDLVPTQGDDFKLRGGMHLCSPYFGPDPNDIGPQHGYARMFKWGVIDHGNRYVVLEHENNVGEYSGLSQRLGIQIVDLNNLQIMIAYLSLSNNGIDSMEVRPGMHPYFSGPAKYGECGSEATRDRRFTRKANYSMREVELSSGIIVHMTSVNMPNFIAWSDNTAEYHCLEPSVTSLDQPLEEDCALLPGESQSYMLSMRVIGGKKKTRSLLNLR